MRKPLVVPYVDVSECLQTGSDLNNTGHALMGQLDAKGLAVSKCGAGVQLGHEAA